jgi:hypothetical protein
MSELIALLTGLAIINSCGAERPAQLVTRAACSSGAAAIALVAATLLHGGLLEPRNLDALSAVALAMLAGIGALALASLPAARGAATAPTVISAVVVALGCWSLQPPADGYAAARTGLFALVLSAGFGLALAAARARLAAGDLPAALRGPVLALATAMVLSLAADGLAAAF